MRRLAAACIDELAVWAWALLVLAGAVELSLRFDLHGRWHFREAAAATLPPRAGDDHRAILSYYFRGGAAPRQGFSRLERAHLADVKRVLDWNRRAAIIALLSLISCSAARRAWRHTARKAVNMLMAVAVFAVLLTGTPHLLIARFWHPVLFPSGAWDFDPRIDRLVQIYDPGYFIGAAACILLLILLGTAALWLLTRNCAKDSPREMRLARWQAGLLLVAVLLAYPGYLGGLHSLAEFDAGHWMYLALCMSAFAGCVLAMRCRNRLNGLVLALAALGLTYAIYGGVRAGFRQAERSIAGARPLIDALTRYCEERGGPPTRLEELRPDYLREFPPVLAGRREWGYLVRGEEYKLYFIGPLGSVFDYTSVARTWHYPPME